MDCQWVAFYGGADVPGWRSVQANEYGSTGALVRDWIAYPNHWAMISSIWPPSSVSWASR